MTLSSPEAILMTLSSLNCAYWCIESHVYVYLRDYIIDCGLVDFNSLFLSMHDIEIF